MLLEGRTAVIYGAGGAIGGAVARAFAREGASLHLAGRTLGPIDAVAREIGGAVSTAEVDALDEDAVEAHVADVVERAGRIDILFNAIGMEDVQGIPLLEIPLDDLAHPVLTATRTQFLTARAVGRRMAQQGSGVLLTVTAEPTPAQNLGGFMAACATVEALWRSFACELGPYGVRTVVVRSAGSPDTPGLQAVAALHSANSGVSAEEYQAGWGESTMLGHLPKLAEVADAATLLACDRAGAMTAAIVNVTCGAFVDL